MMRRSLAAWLGACLVGVVVPLGLLRAAPSVPPAFPGPARSGGVAIDPRLKRPGADAAARRPILVFVAPSAPASSGPRPDAEPAVDRLQARFRADSAPLRSFLAGEQAAGRAADVRGLWSIGAVALEAEPATLRALARRPDVRLLALDGRQTLAAELGASDQAAGAAAAEGADAQWNLKQIRADDARRLLGVDGSGVTVAVLDTGVDFHHPLLQPSYRGFEGSAIARHARSWWCMRGQDVFCGVGESYPVDSAAHGTHVLGSIVAPGGIGVAPGARWIAARACAADGCLLSWIVGAVEWILAMGEDRPDIVNLSMGSTEPFESGVYHDFIGRMVDSGIFVTAAIGNQAESLLMPAAFTMTLGVGATMANGEIWNRSARGVTAWHERKPDLVAPGVGITSTLPGGGLGRQSGTSMAAPHAAGVAALVLQAAPDLGPAELKALLMRTASPIGGLGSQDRLLNAYAAVAAVSDVGRLRGRILRAADGEPIVWARVTVATPIGDPLASTLVSPSDGSFALDLHPGDYVVVAEAFGFKTATRRDVRITVDTTTGLEVRLPPDEPMGIFEGRIVAAATGAPLDGLIRLGGVPFTFDSNSTIGFAMRLPERTYDVRVEKLGYRVLTDTVKVSATEPQSRTYRLQAAPRILLVDGDAWAYSGAIDLYRRALERRGYLYDLHSVTDDFAGPGKPGGPPLASKMAGYDLVIWASPLSSPNKVMGAYELGGYLAEGGRALLSGQDLLCQDSGREVPGQPCNENGPLLPYVRDQLLVRVTADSAARPETVTGLADGPLHGLELSLNGPGSLRNQASPDALEMRGPGQGRIILRYASGEGAAALVDTCVGHRAAVLGFGLEGVGDDALRATVLERLIDALLAPPAPEGLAIQTDSGGRVQPAGGQADYRLTVQNTGSGPAVFQVELSSSDWPASLWHADFALPSDGRLELGPCQTEVLGLRVQVPADAEHGSLGRTQVLVHRPGGSPERSLEVETRTPAPLLVVDGDYGNESEERYLQALRALGVPYEHLELGLLNVRPMLPTTATLRSHPMLLWFTGYSGLKLDRHFGPEIQGRVADYLDAGGRLLLSSEDYLYHWGATPYRDERLFHSERFGLRGFAESDGLAHQGPLTGAPGSAFDGVADCRLAPKPLQEDFSDRLEPRASPGVRPSLLNLLGEPVGVQHEQFGGYKTLFLALDGGALSPSCAEALIGRALDWFNPWTASRLEAVDDADRLLSRPTYSSGQTVHLRLRLSYGGPAEEAAVTVRWALPVEAELAGTVPAGWRVEGNELVWEGRLQRLREQVTRLSLRLKDDLPAGLESGSAVTIRSDNLSIRRESRFRVNAADLRSSSKSVPDEQREVAPGDEVKFVVNVINTGTRAGGRFVVTDTLPSGLSLIPDQVLVDRGQWRSPQPGVLVWEADGLEPGRGASLAYRARLTSRRGGWLVNRAQLWDETGERLAMEARVFARPELIFPWLAHEADPDP